jgi:hypothetical protein
MRHRRCVPIFEDVPEDAFHAIVWRVRLHPIPKTVEWALFQSWDLNSREKYQSQDARRASRVSQTWIPSGLEFVLEAKTAQLRFQMIQSPKALRRVGG